MNNDKKDPDDKKHIRDMPNRLFYKRECDLTKEDREELLEYDLRELPE